MNSIVEELRAMAARMHCSSDHPDVAHECGTTTCEKARLEAIADGLLHGADISWLRPFREATLTPTISTFTANAEKARYPA